MATDSGPGQSQAASSGEDVLLSSEAPYETGLLDWLLILNARKRLILGMALAGGLLAGTWAFLLPPTYTASAVIMPPAQQQSSAAALLGQIGAFGSLAAPGLGLRNPADPYVGILSSRTVADEMIAQFGLKSVYRVRDLTNARKKLASATRFNSAKYSLIQISVEDRDRQRAADMANAYVDQLQKQNSRLAVTEASQRRLFFERQLEAEKQHLAEAEADLKRTQEQKGIFQVSSQVEAVIGSMARMRAEIAAREVGLQRLKAGATTQNPEVLRQEIELAAMRTQLRSLEASDAKKMPGDPLLTTSAMPGAGLEYLRRLREVKYRESLFELLARQYEAARIDEAKEAPVIQVVDRAVPPDQKSGPKRSQCVIIGILLAGILGWIVAVFQHKMQDPLYAQKIATLKAGT